MVKNKKNKDAGLVDADKLREITLDSLNKQRDAVQSQLDAYKKMEDSLGVDLFPFIYIANMNLLSVIDKTIDILQGAKK